VSLRVRSGLLIVCAAGALAAHACGGSPTSPGPQPQPTPNAPPVIESIAVDPARVEVDSDVTVTATVRDAETPVSQLTYQWTAAAGTFTGQGATVTWRVPEGSPTPQSYTLTLTVVERYGSSGAQEHRVSGTSPAVRVHDSEHELSELALDFLGDFVDNSVPAATAVRNFADSCDGKADELVDVQRIRDHYEVVSSSFSIRSVELNAERTMGTISASCAFDSYVRSCPSDVPGCVADTIDRPRGECVFTARYEQDRWWLCSSRFLTTDILSPAMRAMLGVR